ncbi:MAG: RluA family pseudouridine synthase [Lentihominibacter sp.]|jgi:23S rRNA pseudouridine1911/1915/1917 synthase
MQNIIQSFQVNITEENKGTRLDLVLSATLEDYSRSFIHKLFESGNVEVNGTVCDSKKYKAFPGDTVTVNIPEPEMTEVSAEDIPINIVYEDDDMLVVDKPAGMVVHPAAGNSSGTLVNALMYHCGDNLSSINGPIRRGIVHRTDKDTSGLLMVAKNDAAHRILSVQLAEHSVNRRYRAIVWNNIREDEGTIDACIGRDPGNRMRNAVVTPDRPDARKAVTHFRVLERLGRFTFIEVKLETGRTHQIRVHMKYRGHPLLGDELYGPVKNRHGAGRQMLHAGILGFSHPSTGEYMEFESPIPEDMAKVLQKLR